MIPVRSVSFSMEDQAQVFAVVEDMDTDHELEAGDSVRLIEYDLGVSFQGTYLRTVAGDAFFRIGGVWQAPC